MPVAHYREFAPCDALREHVRAFFTFTPPDAVAACRTPRREVVFREGDSFSSPLFADGCVSLVFSFEPVCAGGRWSHGSNGPAGAVIGAMSGVGGPSPSSARPEMAGVYFRAAHVSSLLHVPAPELTDRVVPFEDVCGRRASGLAAALAEAGHAARLDLLESALLGLLAPRAASSAIDVPGLASWASRCGGRIHVERMASAAGVSRQHLRRVFHERAGVTPKLYCRLARYQQLLGYAGAAATPDWAQAAVELGFSDQSHMISECRHFTSLTPQQLASGKWFHPFIERAKDARRRGNT